MKLEIVCAEGKGVLGDERVWFSVKEDIHNLSFYVVSDNTFENNGMISNELRHPYWFPRKVVRRGDYVLLWTKEGTNSEEVNDQGTTTHTFYWGLKRTVWNKDGDCVLLMTIQDWTTKGV